MSSSRSGKDEVGDSSSGESDDMLGDLKRPEAVSGLTEEVEETSTYGVSGNAGTVVQAADKPELM